MQDTTQPKVASGLNVIAGGWLILAPRIMGFGGSLASTDITLGIIVGVLSIIRVASPLRTSWVSWINGLAGIWLLLTSFLTVNEPGSYFWNNLIMGIIVLVLAIWSAASTARITSDKSVKVSGQQ